MELTEIRENINQLDTQISQLFEKRFECSQAVSDFKSKSQSKTNVPEREKKIIEVRQKEVSKRLRPYYRTFLQELMALSRSYQYAQSTYEQAIVRPYLEQHDLEKTLEISFDRYNQLFIILSIAHTLKIIVEAIDTDQETNRYKLLISTNNRNNLYQFVTQVYLETNNCLIK